MSGTPAGTVVVRLLTCRPARPDGYRGRSGAVGRSAGAVLSTGGDHPCGSAVRRGGAGGRVAARPGPAGELQPHLGDGVIEAIVDATLAKGQLKPRRQRDMSYPLVIRLVIAMTWSRIPRTARYWRRWQGYSRTWSRGGDGRDLLARGRTLGSEDEPSTVMVAGMRSDCESVTAAKTVAMRASVRTEVLGVGGVAGKLVTERVSWRNYTASRPWPSEEARRGPARGPAPGESPVSCVRSWHPREALVQVRARVATERASHNLPVAGSSPARPTCGFMPSPVDS